MLGLENARTRLCACGVMISGGVVAGALGAVGGFAPGLALALNGAIAVGGIAANVLATDLCSALASPLGTGVLQNRDLSHLVGKAISVALLSESKRRGLFSSERWKLRRLSHQMPRRCESIGLAPSLVGMGDHELVALFSQTVDASDRATALTPGEWESVIDFCSREAGVQISQTTRRQLGQRLQLTVPKAIRELLKHDFQSGGKAFAGLHLMLLGEILGAIKKASSNGVDTMQDLAKVDASLQSLIHETNSKAGRVLQTSSQDRRVVFAAIIDRVTALRGNGTGTQLGNGTGTQLDGN